MGGESLFLNLNLPKTPTPSFPLFAQTIIKLPYLSFSFFFLQSYQTSLGPNLTIFNAFSRESSSGKKTYVQHLMKQNAKLIADLLLAQKSNFYVCGDASHMAREVSDMLVAIVAEAKGVDVKKGEEVIKGMRSTGAYQEDVWS